jgi:hypothetical protein
MVNRCSHLVRPQPGLKGEGHDQRTRRSAEQQPPEPVEQPVVTAAHDDPRDDPGCQPGNHKDSQNERAHMITYVLCPRPRKDRTDNNRCEAACR